MPNGRQVGTDFYQRKLAWLESLHDWIAATYKPSDPIIMMGDFNVAPEDRDLWSPKAFIGDTHVTEPERAAVARLRDWGFVDAFRALYPQDKLFTYWDYRRGDFHEHRGMRIERRSAKAKAGTIPGVRTPITIGGEPMAAEHPAPRLGEHTAEILREIGEG